MSVLTVEIVVFWLVISMTGQRKFVWTALVYNLENASCKRISLIRPLTFPDFRLLLSFHSWSVHLIGKSQPQINWIWDSLIGNLNMANVQMWFLNQIFFPQQTERGLRDDILFKVNMALFCFQFQIVCVSVGKKFLLKCFCDIQFFLFWLSRSQFKLILTQEQCCECLNVTISSLYSWIGSLLYWIIKCGVDWKVKNDRTFSSFLHKILIRLSYANALQSPARYTTATNKLDLPFFSE